MNPQDLENQNFETLSQNNEPMQAEMQAQDNTSVTSIENMQTDNDSQAQNSLSDSEVTPSKVTNMATGPGSSKKNTRIMVIFIIVLAVLIFGGLTTILMLSNIFNQKPAEPITDIEQETEKYDVSISGNGLNDFDLTFLKIENDDETNIVYSPLSIKYALTMLNDGVNGETKEQIAKVLGSYQAKSYQNSANLSIANALFVNNAKKEQMLPSYEETLKKYNASVVYDDFSTPDNINTWISERTFGLINDLAKDVDAKLDSFALANTLAIDMEWKNKIQPTREDVANKQTKYTQYSNGIFAYDVHFKYEKVYESVPILERSPTINYAAIANRYDIINKLGEENIRTEVQKEYNKWTQDVASMCTAEEISSQTPNLDEYVNTLSQHYGHLSSSTDFYFYDDVNVTAFAKDLKTYDDATLQYVAISPKDGNIAEYIKNMSAEDLNNVINNLKNAEDQNSYEEGYVTIVDGGFYEHNFDYELKLLEDLKMLGIERVFDKKEAELDKISTEKPIYIKQVLHKTNFTFLNSGIKATTATYAGTGLGSTGTSCEFKYDFEVPKKEIEFDENRYLFLIRDKDSGEIWFVGLKNNDDIPKKQSSSDT